MFLPKLERFETSIDDLDRLKLERVENILKQCFSQYLKKLETEITQMNCWCSVSVFSREEIFV